MVGRKCRAQHESLAHQCSSASADDLLAPHAQYGGEITALWCAALSKCTLYLPMSAARSMHTRRGEAGRFCFQFLMDHGARYNTSSMPKMTAEELEQYNLKRQPTTADDGADNKA